MTNKEKAYEPAYSTKSSPLKFFMFLFFMGLGLVGLFGLIPLCLLFGYMLVDADHVALYAFSLIGLNLVIGGGITIGKMLYKQLKMRLIHHKYPSGYDLLDEKLTFQWFNVATNDYIYGEIPYDKIKTCVISINPEPIIRAVAQNRMKVTGYVYQPVTHLVYQESGENKTYTMIHNAHSINDMLDILKTYHVPIEVTEYNLESVPEDMMLRVITRDIETKPLRQTSDLTAYIDPEREYAQPPTVYNDAYAEWLVKDYGIINKTYTQKHAFTLLILLSLLPFFTLAMFTPNRIWAVMITYAAVTISYVFFIYCLKKVKYWKTIPHFVITLAIYIGILYVSGYEPFTFQTENVDAAFGTMHNELSEAVIGTILGFYGSSLVYYLLGKEVIRNRWPAHFHHDVQNILQDK